MSALDYHVSRLISQIQEMCPQAEVRISEWTYEDEDVDLYVTVPKGKAYKLSEKVSELTFDLRLETGYGVVVFFREKQKSRKKTKRAATATD